MKKDELDYSIMETVAGGLLKCQLPINVYITRLSAYEGNKLPYEIWFDHVNGKEIINSYLLSFNLDDECPRYLIRRKIYNHPNDDGEFSTRYQVISRGYILEDAKQRTKYDIVKFLTDNTVEMILKASEWKCILIMGIQHRLDTIMFTNRKGVKTRVTEFDPSDGTVVFEIIDPCVNKDEFQGGKWLFKLLINKYVYNKHVYDYDDGIASCKVYFGSRESLETNKMLYLGQIYPLYHDDNGVITDDSLEDLCSLIAIGIPEPVHPPHRLNSIECKIKKNGKIGVSVEEKEYRKKCIEIPPLNPILMYYETVLFAPITTPDNEAYKLIKSFKSSINIFPGGLINYTLVLNLRDVNSQALMLELKSGGTFNKPEISLERVKRVVKDGKVGYVGQNIDYWTIRLELPVLDEEDDARDTYRMSSIHRDIYKGMLKMLEAAILDTHAILAPHSK